MEPTVFNRAFLQSLPDQDKQDIIQRYLKDFIRELLQVAKTGRTSLMLPTYDRPNNMHMSTLNPSNYPLRPMNVTNDDLLAALKKKFPDCAVTYQEEWAHTNPTTRTLQKGILIDWS